MQFNKKIKSIHHLNMTSAFILVEFLSYACLKAAQHFNLCSSCRMSMSFHIQPQGRKKTPTKEND